MDTLVKELQDLNLYVEEPQRYEKWRAIVGNYKHQDSSNIISKYIFAPRDVDSFECDMFYSDEFMKYVVEDIFYGLRDDTGWNLYLVCIMEPEQFRLLSLERRLAFQNNRDFTRNFVISRDKLREEIPVGTTLKTSMRIEFENPYSDWIRVLDKYGLSFCLGAYSSVNVENYINGIEQPRKKESRKGNIHSASMVRTIERLNLRKDFRQHCYGADNKLDFSKVNLLTGANGTGKTSILQAIELVMTGEIRTDSKGATSDESGSQISIEYDNGETLLIPSDTPVGRSEKKQRESLWYHNRDNLRAQNKLNNAFHIYNCFSVEDTIQFAFYGDQPDYNDCFTKILFGEEVKTAESCWKRYELEFKDQENRINAQYMSISEELSALESVPQSEKETIIHYIDRLSILHSADDSMEDIKMNIIGLQTLCYPMLDLPRITSRNHLALALEEQSKLIGAFEQKSNSLRLDIEALENTYDNLEKEIASCVTKRNTLYQEKASLQFAISRYEDLLFIRDEFDLIIEYREKHNEIYALQERLGFHRRFVADYSSLVSVGRDYDEYESAAVHLKINNSEIECMINEANSLENELDALESRQKNIDDIVRSIKAYGKLYLESVEAFHGCPLCGNKNITLDSFQVHLNAESSGLDTELLLIKQKLTDVQNSILSRESANRQLEELAITFGLINMAFSECFFDQTVELEQKSEKLTFVLKQLKESNEYIRIYEELSRELNDINAVLSERASGGVLHDIIWDCETFISKLENELDLPVEPSATLITRTTGVIRLLKQKQNEWENWVPEIEQKLDELTASKNNIEEKITIHMDILSKTENDILHQVEYGHGLEKIRAFFQQVYSYVNENMKEIDIQVLHSQCLFLVEQINKYLIQQEQALQRDKLLTQKDELEKKLKLINEVINKMSELDDSHKYAVKFISSYIGRISDIFRSLHMPNEFDCLKLHHGQIVGVRKGEDVPINRMSTGQKTAVVLSVFLTLNIAMKSAPQIILLDEPISNVDEMNLLSLLDFLREMVLQYNKQIFFTTANDNVRRLFRRKFSFLGKDMTEFGFERNGPEKTKITVKQYDQSKLLSQNEILFAD